jgi:integrase
MCWRIRRRPSALPKQKQPLPKSIHDAARDGAVLNTPDVDTPLGLRDRAILELMYSTGLRNMEVRNLKLYDVNTRRGGPRALWQRRGGPDGAVGRDRGEVCGSLRERGAAKAFGVAGRSGVFVSWSVWGRWTAGR